MRRPGSHPQPQRRPAPVREPALATEPVTPVEALHRMEAPRADQHKVAVGELDRAPGGQYVWWVSHVSSPGRQRRCSLHRQRRRIALHRSSLGSSEALLTPTQRHASPEPERPEPAEASQWPEPAEAPCGEPLGQRFPSHMHARLSGSAAAMRACGAGAVQACGSARGGAGVR